MTTRYRYAGLFRKFSRADEALGDMWANGEIGPLEAPQIDPVRNHRGRLLGYEITLLG